MTTFTLYQSPSTGSFIIPFDGGGYRNDLSSNNHLVFQTGDNVLAVVTGTHVGGGQFGTVARRRNRHQHNLGIGERGFRRLTPRRRLITPSHRAATSTRRSCSLASTHNRQRSRSHRDRLRSHSWITSKLIFSHGGIQGSISITEGTVGVLRSSQATGGTLPICRSFRAAIPSPPTPWRRRKAVRHL